MKNCNTVVILVLISDKPKVKKPGEKPGPVAQEAEPAENRTPGKLIPAAHGPAGPSKLRSCK